MKYETIILNDKIRAELGGKYAKISDGYVHYELKGQENAELVILIHGFSMPMFLWEPTFNSLVNDGFRVLRYDLFGRGFSDSPRKKYNGDLYIRQLHELLINLKLNKQKVNLCGLSMGGLISVLYANKYPDRVKKVSLIDPAGLPFESKQPFILKIPILNKIAFNIIGHKSLIVRVSNNFHKPENFEDFVDKFSIQLKYKGYLRAILSTMINFPMSEYKSAYEELALKNIPVQLFWGEFDKILPYSNAKKVCSVIPRTEFRSIPNSGHLCHYESPNLVNPDLIRFLKS